MDRFSAGPVCRVVANARAPGVLGHVEFMLFGVISYSKKKWPATPLTRISAEKRGPSAILAGKLAGQDALS